MAKASQSSILAAKFIQDCQSAGFTVTRASGSVVSCKALFPAGDNTRYCQLDSAASALMLSLKTTASGSLWGSTSDGVGGAVALQQGCYVINRSGVSEHLVKAIARLQHDNNARLAA